MCGEGGIRTLGALARTTVFETATFNHSATSPGCFFLREFGGFEFNKWGDIPKESAGYSLWRYLNLISFQSFELIISSRFRLSVSLSVLLGGRARA